MFRKIKSAARAVAGKAGDTLSAGFDKLKGPLDELSVAAPEFERIGYRVREIEVVCTLLPRLVVYLTREAAVNEDAYGAVLAAQANNQTFQTVAGLLRQADRLLDRVKLKGRRCTALAVELGVPPSLRLIYGCPDTRAVVPGAPEAAVPASSPAPAVEPDGQEKGPAEAPPA
jgi:hypothetical protein